MHPPLRITPGTSRRSRLDVALWIMPMAFVLGALVLAVLTDRIDQWMADSGRTMPWLLDRGDVDDLRVLTGTVAGASITTLALVLSLTMVVLSNASTQFGPRLVRSFLRSRVTKVTISVFTGLFVYSILVLDSASATGQADRPVDGRFLPEVGGTVVLVGSIAAVSCLIWYLHHITSSIQLSALVAAVVSDLDEAVLRVGEPLHDAGSAHGARSADDLRTAWESMSAGVEADGVEIETARSGYVQLIERRPLVDAAVAAGGVVQMVVRAGDFVVEGQTIARVHPPSAAAALAEACAKRIDVGPHRTLDQDLQLAVDQVVEVALRALSAAVNDTFTGLTCLDWLAEALITLSSATLGRTVHADASGAPRLVERQHSYAGIVNSAYEKIRQAGVDNPAVTIRLMESIGRVADVVVDPAARAALGRQADACFAASAPRHVELDREALTGRYVDVCRRLDRQPLVAG